MKMFIEKYYALAAGLIWTTGGILLLIKHNGIAIMYFGIGIMYLLIHFISKPNKSKEQ